MKIITKRWMKTFFEVQEALSSGKKTKEIEEKMAWLEEKADELQKAFEKEKMDDFAERNCRIYEDGKSIVLDVDDVGRIVVENATVVEDEINISSLSDSVLIKAWEMYPIGNRTKELHIMVERDGEEYYVTLMGKVFVE